MKRGFQEFVVTESPLSLFKTVKVLSFSRIVFSLFISSALWIFLSCMYGEMHTVFRCSPSNWPWHSFVCSVAPDNSHFPLMLSCWCSMHRVRTLFFFDLLIYFPLLEQSNWYIPGWLFGSRLGLFLSQSICCGFFPDVKIISFPIFLNSRFIFELMFGIQGSFFRFLYSQFSVLFSWLFLFFIYCCILLLSFSKVACYGHFQGTYRLKIFLLLWYISRNISSVLCERNLGIHFWWC